MPIFGNPLTKLIDQLDASIPYVNEGLSWGFAIERHDWRPVWSLCREIQTTFKGYKGFETKQQRQEAWERFCELRNRASRLADIEKEKFADQSTQLKDEIVTEARATYWCKSADFFIGSILGQTTVEEMQDLQHRLNNAGKRLSENKRLMTRVDKDECFEAIKNSRESHDRFWEKYKAHSQERREASQRKREDFERKRAQWINHVQSNIRKHREKLEKAEAALNHIRDRISDLEDKLSETTSPKCEGLFSVWLEEARSKERDIEDSIERIVGWIADDETKLYDT